MNIKELTKLGKKIDNELSWRKKELTSIKVDVESSKTKEKSEESRAIRSGIILLYAHWEGAIKAIAEYYLIYVSGLNLKYGELKSNFLAIAMKRSLIEFQDTKKASVHNKFIDDIYAKKNEVSRIPCNKIIKTDSNLKMETFREITATIGIDDSKYMLKKMIIDNRLLGNRNKIAHGARIDSLDGISCVADYIEMHTMVVELIDKFAEDIKNAAINAEYKIKSPN